MAEVAALGLGAWLVCAFAVFCGTFLQRLTGQGFGMVAAPIIALVAPEFLPAALLLLGAAVGLGATAFDRGAVARNELPAGFVGRAVGAVLATLIALALPDAAAFSAVVALVVYLGIALSLLGVRVEIRPATLFPAGVVAGLMGTLTAVGAPPMALLYQHEEQRRSAAMQNTFFAWGMVVSIASLAVAGLVRWPHVVLAVTLLPVSLVAIRASRPIARRVARASIRPYALTLAGLAATVLLLKQVL